MFLFPSPKTYRTYAWYLYGFMVVNFEKKVVMWWSFVLSLSMVSCVQINWKKWKTKYKKKAKTWCNRRNKRKYSFYDFNKNIL